MRILLNRAVVPSSIPNLTYIVSGVNGNWSCHLQLIPHRKRLFIQGVKKVTRYAIIIGVEHYANYSPTTFSHADASYLWKTLVECCDYSEQHTLLMNLSIGDGQSPAVVMDAIRRTISGLGEDDTALFYFAGHGSLLDEAPFLLLPNTIPGEA